MNFTPSAEQEALIASASALTRAHFGVPAGRRDIPAHVSAAELAPFARNGFAGIALAAAEGGQGGSPGCCARYRSGDAGQPHRRRRDPALNFGAIQQLAHLGTADLKARYLRPCLEGKLLTAIAMTESEAGSAVSSLKSTARLDGSNVILNGAKIFTTHGADADFMVVWVRFSDDRSALGAVVVERGTLASQSTVLITSCPATRTACSTWMSARCHERTFSLIMTGSARCSRCSISSGWECRACPRERAAGI